MVKFVVLTQLPPPNNGAAFMNRVANQLLIGEYDCITLDLSLSETVTQSNVFSIRKLGLLFRNYIRLCAILLHNKVEFCYFTITPTGMSFIKDAVFVVILKVFNVRLIYHLHGSGVKARYKGFYKFVYDYVFSHSKIISLSKSLVGDVGFIKGVDVYVLNNFSSLEVAFPETDSSDKLRLGFLSNLRAGKGIMELIEIAHCLERKNVEFEIVVAGPWSSDLDRDRFFSHKLLLDNNLLSKFNFLGEADEEKRVEFYSNIDVFLFPSFIDTFPLVMLEAISFGKPVISSDVGGIPDIAESCGSFMFSHSDPQKYEKICEEIMKLKIGEYYKMKSKSALEAHSKLYAKDVFLRNFKYTISTIVGEGGQR